jgi:TPR repeat protein
MPVAAVGAVTGSYAISSSGSRVIFDWRSVMMAVIRKAVTLAAVFLWAGTISAQQAGGPPIYVGKSNSTPAHKTAAAASLTVICDLACHWDLDQGKSKGDLKAGVSAKVPVGAGEHTLTVTTADGLDSTQQQIQANRGEQKPVIVELTPIRNARLAAEQAAEEKKEEAAREQAALQKQQQAQQQASLEDTRQAYQLYLQQRYVESRPYAEKACANGNLAACKLLGSLFKNGLGGTQDYVQARTLFEKACTGNSSQYPDACANLGDLYEHGYGVTQNYPQASALYQKACAGKYWDGCWMLGNLYEYGLGVTQDYSQARTLDQQACDSGDMLGCVYLGGLYLNGTGAPRDVAQTLALYQKACNGGSTVGCTRLGALYETGKAGGAVDYAQAAAFYKRACDSGGLDGCNSLGLMYQNARGVPKNKHYAHTLFDKACDGGLQDACNNKRLPQ